MELSEAMDIVTKRMAATGEDEMQAVGRLWPILQPQLSRDALRVIGQDLGPARLHRLLTEERLRLRAGSC